MHVPHAAPSVSMVRPVPMAMDTAATIGELADAATKRNAAHKAYAAEPTKHRPTRIPYFADNRSLSVPPNKSLGTLTSKGKPERKPSAVASKPCRFLRYVGNHEMQK